MSTLPDKGYYTTGIDIDTEIPWPSKEVVIDFRGRKFHLIPETANLSRMVRVETTTGFTRDDAMKLTLEFLSSLAWAEQRGVVPTFGNWCTAPLAVGKGPSGGCFFDGTFDYLPDPPNPKAKLALALYREGLSVNLIPYKILGFFKVINIICNKSPAQKRWITDNLQYVTDIDASKRIIAIQRTEPDVARYLYESGRCAVAHAFQNNVVNPDDPDDLVRLRNDLPVIRELARIAIEREFDIKSLCDFHHEHLYELDGFRTMFGDNLVTRIKALEEVPAADVLIPKTLALRLRGRDRIELFESMDATIVYVRDGCVRLRLVSACHRLIVFVTLDFTRETLVSDPLTDIQYHDDGTPDAAKMMLQWAQIHRWWFGGNGVIELWDKVSDTRLARSQPYMPPVNSRFPHDAFEKMEHDLRIRAGFSDPSENPDN